MEEPVYRLYEISRLCDVPVAKALGWIMDGKLPAVKTEDGNHRVTRPDLVAFLEKSGIPVPAGIRHASTRVLIVDDEQSIVDVIKKMIDSLGAHIVVETALDGFVAGRKVEAFQPDLVILDIMLPGLNGFQVCRNIRADAKLKSVKILAITAENTESFKSSIFSCGADDFLPKPFQQKDMLEKVAKLLGVQSPARKTES